MKMQKRETINITAYPGEGLFSSVITNQMDHSFVEPFLGKIYSYAIPVSSQDEAYEKMRHRRLPQQIFIENYGSDKARLLTDKALHMSKGTVNLIYSSYNRVKFRVMSEMPAFFGLSYPYTGYWKAWVNGNQVRVYRANGAAQAVEIPQGESVIEFRYWSPAAFWGIVISSLTFVLIGLYVCSMSLNGFSRIIISVCLAILGVGFVTLWYYSLYTGDNLETKYTWTYTPPKETPNIAYGKKTSHVPVPPGIYYDWYLKGGQYLNHDSRVVDGNKSEASGFKIPPKDEIDVFIDSNRNVTHLDKNKGLREKLIPDIIPSLTIDLNNKEILNSVVIYASTMVNSEIKCNFEVLTSPDREIWESAAFATPDLKHHEPVRIKFDSPQRARYVQIKVSGSRKIILDEVEIYR